MSTSSMSSSASSAWEISFNASFPHLNSERPGIECWWNLLYLLQSYLLNLENVTYITKFTSWQEELPIRREVKEYM